jgi:hypothetical protein
MEISSPCPGILDYSFLVYIFSLSDFGFSHVYVAFNAYPNLLGKKV